MATEVKNYDLLVVGGSGYFGSRVVKWLVHESGVPASQITVLDTVQPSVDRQVPHVHYHQADITDQSSVTQVVADYKPGIIIHTASPPYYLGNLDTFMLNNEGGTRNLLEAAVAEPSVHAFLYTSSSSVIHDYVSDLVEADESWPLLFMPEQRQPYHHSKAVAEKLALGYNRKREDFVVAAIRPSAMFGPGERIMIPGMVERAKSGSLRFQIGNGTNLADFTYVDNTVYGLVLALEALLTALQDGAHAAADDLRVEGEAFTITNDVHANFWNFARQVGAKAGYPVDASRIVVIPKALGLGVAFIVEWFVWLFSFGTKTAKVRRLDLNYSTITRTFDITKAKKRLGYRPRFSLDEGIELSVAALVEGKKDT